MFVEGQRATPALTLLEHIAGSQLFLGPTCMQFTQDAPLETWGWRRRGARHSSPHLRNADWLDASPQLKQTSLHGPEKKPCKCRGACRLNCKTRRMQEAARKIPQPKQYAIVKDETFTFLIEDRVGAPHTSELRPEDEVVQTNGPAAEEQGESAASFSLPTSYPS